MPTKNTADKNTVEGTVIPTQNNGDDQSAEVVELNQTALTKVKVFLGSNKKFLIGMAAGVISTFAFAAGANRLINRNQDDEVVEISDEA